MPVIFASSLLVAPSSLARFTDAEFLKTLAVALYPGGAPHSPPSLLCILSSDLDLKGIAQREGLLSVDDSCLQPKLSTTRAPVRSRPGRLRTVQAAFASFSGRRGKQSAARFALLAS